MAKELVFGTGRLDLKDNESKNPLPPKMSSAVTKSTSELQKLLDAFYENNKNLKNKVEGIGYGWQKYVFDSSKRIIMTIRGASGGHTISESTDLTTLTNKTNYIGGRGAKLVGTMKVKKNDIFYLLVGLRGNSNTTSSWGASGGGASVILRVNPAGKYNFAVTNEKVDVLMVAGGGGGSADSDGVYKSGYDAVLENGTNTNAGSSDSACGGAGLLTGASSSGGSSKAILSGQYDTYDDAYAGAWGGGGGGWNGGGGGGGYSGGNATDSDGGKGGTSYINEELVREISRGYPQPGEDNILTPYMANGEIMIVARRGEDKFILAQDAEGYKYFDGREYINKEEINNSATNLWKLLPNQDKSEDNFKNFGNMDIISSNGLLDEFKLFVLTSDEKDDISIEGNITNTILKMKDPISLLDIREISKINVKFNSLSANIRYLVEFDKSNEWKVFKNGEWEVVDITNENNIYDKSLPISELTTIPREAFRELKPQSIKFMFVITQRNEIKNPVLESISVEAVMETSWKQVPNTEYDIEYMPSGKMKITFKKAGTYKVNYIDKQE